VKNELRHAGGNSYGNPGLERVFSIFWMIK